MKNWPISASVVRISGLALCVALLLWALWWSRFYAGLSNGVVPRSNATKWHAVVTRPVIPGVLLLASLYSFSILVDEKQKKSWLGVFMFQLALYTLLNPVLALKFLHQLFLTG